MRSASFGKTWLTGDVTPWLHALASKPRCNTAAIAQAAQSAARAGYDLARYTTVGIAMAHLDACPWGGAYFPPGIWLNGRHDRHVIAHELGHTYGVSEEGSAWICDPSLPCPAVHEPLQRHGSWLERLRRVGEACVRVVGPGCRAGIALDDRRDRPAEHEPPGAAGARGRRRVLVRVPASGARLVVRVGRLRTRCGDSRRVERSRRAESLLGTQPSALQPGGARAPVVQSGETFSVRGLFAIRVESATADSAGLAFRWTDRTRPAKPKILSARIRRGRLFVRWRRGAERGSGVAAHEVFVDGRRAGRVPAVRTVANLLVVTDDRLAVRVAAGGTGSRSSRSTARGIAAALRADRPRLARSRDAERRPTPRLQ